MTFDVVLHDGIKQVKYSLNRSYVGLYVPSLIWRQLENFSSNSLTLIVSNINYNKHDYLRNFEEFKKITPITGIIMTKLDGTAKGGILLAIGRKFKLPIVALGMGEKEDDLQKFNSDYFSNALMHS